MLELRTQIRSRLIAWKKWRQDAARKLRFAITQLRWGKDRVGQVGFVIAGAQKSGTTALDAYLREHPNISMAEKKELHFFDVERHFRTAPDYFLYHSYFNWQSNASSFGEATPNYMYSSRAVERIRAYNSKMKFIIVLRNPIDRAFSHWNMEKDRGYETEEFLVAIEAELLDLRHPKATAQVQSSYLKRGFYVSQIQRLWSLFSKQQVLVLRYESLRTKRVETLAKVANFLALPPFPPNKQREVHARSYQRKMTSQERQLLEGVYADEINTLEKLLGWDCTEWHQ